MMKSVFLPVSVHFFSKPSYFSGWLFLAFFCFVPPVLADKSLPAFEKNWVHITQIEGDFETISSFLKSSIEEEGLTITYEGDVSKMLERTKEAVGPHELVFSKARFYQFCSAKLAVDLFALSPANIAACPLAVFTYELKKAPNLIYVGYRRPPIEAGAPSVASFKKVDALLARIVKRAVE